MVYFISGKIVHKTEKFVVVENNGIGYKVFATEDMLLGLKPDQDAKFYTYLYVREDALDLYGFLTREDLEFFEMLISVSGIGPKSAIGILSIASTRTIKSSILTDDAGIMTKVSGIGHKTAAKIILELKSKLQNAISKEDMDSYLKGDFKEDMEVLDALVGLGYSRGKVQEALRSVSLKNKSVEQKIKECLKILGGG